MFFLLFLLQMFRDINLVFTMHSMLHAYSVQCKSARQPRYQIFILFISNPMLGSIGNLFTLREYSNSIELFNSYKPLQKQYNTHMTIGLCKYDSHIFHCSLCVSRLSSLLYIGSDSMRKYRTQKQWVFINYYIITKFKSYKTIEYRIICYVHYW